MVCGHIHPAYGLYRLGDTEIVNASVVDNDYEPVHPVVEITL
jgi:Icc-related predicted phosphoesterase